jgi:inositol 3-alpha-galactosyltransferase
MSTMFSSRKAAPKRAYVTFLAGDYWNGVVGLAKGLRRARSAYPLVVAAVLPDVPEDRRRKLAGQGCIVRDIQPESQTRFAMAYYVVNYSKLRIWELVEYERMVYLDADIQVFENMDELEKGAFYAVKDCFCEKTWSHTPQHRVGYCQQCPDRARGALLQRRHVRARAQPRRRQGPPRRARGRAADALRRAGLPQLVLPRQVQAHPQRVQPRAGHAVEAPGERGAGQGQGRALLRRGVQAVEPNNMDRDDIKLLVKKWWDIFNDGTLDYS